MSQRSAELVERANRQIDDIGAVFATLGEADLSKASGRRSGSIGDEAAHIAEGYHFLLRFLRTAGYLTGGSHDGSIHGRPSAQNAIQLRNRLEQSRAAIAELKTLTDDQLDSVPPPKSSRFSNGRRTLQHVIEEVIAHQELHLVDLRGSIGERTKDVDHG